MSDTSGTPRTTLREAHKALTRERICEAAKALFFDKGYAATTADEIAIAAAMQRSTLYAHFKDKEDILRAIEAAHGVKLEAAVARFSKSLSTRAEIDRWIGNMGKFAQAERMPIALFVNIGESARSEGGVSYLAQVMLEALARTVPAFRVALTPGPDAVAALVRAQQVLREVCWAHLYREQHGDTPYARETLRAAGDLFEAFLNQWPKADPALSVQMHQPVRGRD